MRVSPDKVKLSTFLLLPLELIHSSLDYLYRIMVPHAFRGTAGSITTILGENPGYVGCGGGRKDTLPNLDGFEFCAACALFGVRARSRSLAGTPGRGSIRWMPSVLLLVGRPLCQSRHTCIFVAG